MSDDIIEVRVMKSIFAKVPVKEFLKYFDNIPEDYIVKNEAGRYLYINHLNKEICLGSKVSALGHILEDLHEYYSKGNHPEFVSEEDVKKHINKLYKATKDKLDNNEGVVINQI